MNILSDGRSTLLDVLINPKVSFSRLVTSPSFSLAFLLTLAFRLCDEILKASVRDPKTLISFATIFSVFIVGLGWPLWLTLVMFVSSRWGFRAGASAKVCFAMGAHIAFVMVGVSALIEITIISSQRLLGITPQLAFTLPSIGSMLPFPYSVACSQLSLFPLWGTAMAYFALRKIGTGVPSAFAIAFFATVGPVVAYSLTLLRILTSHE